MKRNLIITNEMLEQNIFKNYIYSMLSNFNLTSGVWMLYLAYRGLSLFQIGIIEAIYHITAFTMEVPTGIVADLLGRKTSRVLGRFMTIISIIIMIFGDHVVWFSLSFAFTALGNNLESGAGDALIYDSMKEIGREKGYMKVKGKIEVFFQLASSLALPIGGYLATLDYSYVYKVALVVGIVTLLQSLTFVEPHIGRVEKKDNAMKSFTHQLRESVAVIKNSRKLAFLILMTETIGVSATTTFFYIQNYLKLNGRDEFRIGIVLAIGGLLSAIGASQAHRIEKRFGYTKTLIMVLLGVVFFLWLMVIGSLSEIGMIGLSVVEAIEFVVMSDYINKLIPSERRATVLSMQSMVFSLFMIIIFPIVGLVGDIYNLRTSFMILAVLSTIISGFMIRRILADKINRGEV